MSAAPPARGEDARYMARALALAARGLGETNPNPAVGCVVVRGGRVVGEGFHRRAGGPHAEVAALAQAGARARGATVYVTLEPCAHEGRTPPCAPAVAAAGPRRVVVATGDPNPKVAGRGLRLLRASGIEVTTGVLGDRAALLNERFLVALARGRPFVLLKAGLTLDGRIATAAGRSRWITSPVQRRAARRLRRLFDGIAVGIGTALADDPLLLPEPRTRRPFTRVVFDSRFRLPLGSRLVKTARRQPVVVLGAPGAEGRRRALERAGVRTIALPAGPRPRAALGALWAAGLRSLMVEGGSELLGSFLAARAFDQVALFRAPLLLGGRGSLAAFGGDDPRSLDRAVRLVPRSPLAPGLDPAVDPGLGPVLTAGGELWYAPTRKR
ncbi:MAG: bifunctional diaminohydroxyphosphoribosylaminopyrimidine deaminase/5-amino-6-(5-phosphoribosylamino)uracil reductase RibD [Vicinamibacteria bacterium]